MTTQHTHVVPLRPHSDPDQPVSEDATVAWHVLLIPRLLALRNALRRRGQTGRRKAIIISVLIAAFWLGIFWLGQRALSYSLSIPDLGPILSQKLLHMGFLTFFAILLFSNVITGLSTFFLSRDLQLLIPAPVPANRLFAAKFIETLADSSWMMLLFSLPAFLAFGVVHGAGFAYYAMVILTLIPFLVIAAAIGVIVIQVLAALLPAQRGKDMLFVFAICFLSLFLLFFRLLQPELLVNPEKFADFAAYLTALQAPSSPFLPSTWAAASLLPFVGLADGDAVFHYCLLLSTALFLVQVGSWLSTSLYPIGWSKAQEGKRRKNQKKWWDNALDLFVRFFPFRFRTIMLKDLKIFFRDTGQWSQLFVLLALIVVYVYNFSVFRSTDSSISTFFLKNLAAFTNLALSAFVLASIAVRFVFPAVSLEGKTFWVLRSAPVPLSRLWWSKFWVALLPLLLLGELLVSATNYFLQVSPFMMGLSAVTLFFLTFGIVALGMAVGVAYPNFTAEHSAKIAASFGGVIYMVLSIVFIGIVVVLEAWPVYLVFMSELKQVPLSAWMWSSVYSSLGVALTLMLCVFWLSTRWGIARLEEMEVAL